MTVGEAWRRAYDELEQAGIAEAAAEARYLLAYVLTLSTAELVLTWPEPISCVNQESLAALVERRCSGVPFAYVVGHREFYGRSFVVDERVLVPRPETEALVDFALGLLRNAQSLRELASRYGVVDLCTGSGAVGITLACEEPWLNVAASDIDERAIEVAGANARRMGVTERMHFFVGDLFAAFEFPGGAHRVAMATANPPYVSDEEFSELPPEVRLEPATALRAGKKGLDIIKRLIAQAPDYLLPGGWLCIEVGAGQAPEVQRFFVAAARFDDAVTVDDLAGIPRVVAARLRS